MNTARNGSTGKQEQHRRERDIGEYIREEPLTSLAIAGAAGFILGGGANSKIGLAALAMAGKMALRGAATNFIIGLVVPNPVVANPDDRRTAHAKYSGNHRDERPDNA